MSKYWFGVNRYWGWHPITWEGIVVIVAMITSLCFTAYYIVTNTSSISDTLIALLPFVALIVAFTMLVASFKGAPPHFGKSERKSHNYSPDSPKAYLYLSLVTIPLILYYAYSRAFVGVLVLLVVFCLLYVVYTRLNKIAKAG